MHLGESADTRLPGGLPQHPDEHRPQRPVLLAVDQELGGVPKSRRLPMSRFKPEPDG
jgi:hypothetical protein